MMDTLERLDEQLLDATQPDDARAEGFVVDDMDKATWASRQARKAAREIEAITAWKNERIREIEKATNDYLTEPTNQLERMKFLLADYVVRLARDGRKKKSLTLPGGVVKLTKRPVAMTTDEGKLLAWLKENGHDDYVKVKESVDNAGLKKALERVEGGVVLRSTGEFVPAVDLADQPDSVTFSPNLDEGEPT